MKKINDKELKDALDELVKDNFLKKTNKGYIDSDRVKELLKKGKSRKEIASILKKEVEK